MKTNVRIGLAWLALLLAALPLRAQTPPSLLWQKALGGTNTDVAHAITASGDGGHVVAGYTFSNDGDVTGNHGDNDYWVVKLDAAGNRLWQKALGGTGNDYAFGITASADGGYVVAGYTLSNDGDVTGNHGNADYWVVKLDAAGNRLWQKALGGNGNDYAFGITASGDGGYVVAGYTESNDGDVTGNHGDTDYWVVKLDASGGTVWQKALGGTNTDVAYRITASADGGYVVAGYTRSNDGDVTGNHGDNDYWVVKLDAAGNRLWQKALGGTGEDVARGITASADGGYVVAGYTESNDGDVTGNHGDNDYWVVKLDAAGNRLWQRALGGTGIDVARGITASADGGYVVAGYTYSNDGDVTGNHGGSDYWVVKLDASGSLLWQKTLGGTNTDVAYVVMASGDGGYVVAGYTFSNDGDVAGYHGGGDYWVVKLNATAPTLSGLSANPSPVCAGQSVQFTATVGNVTGSYDYTLTNGAGSTLMGTSTSASFDQSLTASGAGSQTYTLTVTAANGTASTTATLTVNTLPDAGFTGLSGPYCADAAAVTLTPTTAGGLFSGPGVSGSTFTPANAGSGGTITYILTVNGCTSSTSQNVTVKPLPDAGFTGLSGPYCADAAAVTLVPTTPGGTFSGPGVSGSTFTPAMAGTGGSIMYSVTVDGCSNTTQQSVIVKPQPNASFSGLSATYCADAAAVTLTPTTAGGTFSGPGVSGSTFTPTNASSGGSITYTLTVNGCTSSTSQNVSVKPLPDAGFTGLSGPYCADAAAVTLTPTTAGGLFSGPGVSGSTFTPANAGSGGSITYTLTVNGCTSSTSQNVIVKPLPDAGFTGLSGPYCADAAAVTLTPTTAGGLFSGPGVSGSTFTPANAGSGGSITYTLTVNGCTSSITQNVSVKPQPNASFSGLAGPYCADAAAVTLTPATPGGTFSGPGVSGNTFTPANAGNGGMIIYTVSVDGCPNSSTSQSVSVNALPSVNAGSDQSVILGYGSNCTNISATATGAATLTYAWNNGAGSGATVNVCPQQTTTYTVTVTDANGCQATDQVTVNVKDVRCGNQNQNVTICYYGTTQCVSEKTAERYLKLGATLGPCGAGSARIGYEAETTSLPLALSLKAYPNPVQDQMTLEALTPTAGPGTFEVLDLTGRTRQSRTEELTEGLNEVEFSLGALPTGVYLIRAVDVLGRQATMRVSKQ